MEEITKDMKIGDILALNELIAPFLISLVIFSIDSFLIEIPFDACIQNTDFGLINQQ